MYQMNKYFKSYDSGSLERLVGSDFHNQFTKIPVILLNKGQTLWMRVEMDIFIGLVFNKKVSVYFAQDSGRKF
jgi:hypothetical protein